MKETNIDREPIVFVDYEPSKYCKDDDSYGMICIKCGKCGRQFEKGIMTVDEYGFETGKSYDKTVEKLKAAFDEIYNDKEGENDDKD